MVRRFPRWIWLGWVLFHSSAWSLGVPFSSEIPITSSADQARWVQGVDLDRDGDMDAVSASFGDDTIAWYENDGAEGFTRHVIASNAVQARAVLARDVDGDGDVDVLSASSGDDTIAWHENDGAQGFARHVISSTADGAAGVWATDLDRDGDLDVLSASETDNAVAWYENDGTQTFVKHLISSSAAGAVSVFAADLDGDGDEDALSASADDDKVAWYENRLDTPTADFGPELVISTAADGARSVRAADIDRDGDPDVLSASADDDKIAWYENRLSEPSADFGPPAIVSLTADSAGRVDAADLDRDGDLDVLSTSLLDGKIAWYENDGSQGFSERAIGSAGLARDVFTADVDDDGDLDVLSASELDDRVAWRRNESIHSTTEFGPRIEISTTALGARWVSVADMDRDGDFDVQSASHDDSTIAWYENNGSQGFTEHVIGTEEYQARFVQGVDMDNDGDVDVLSSAITDDVVVWENNGSQSFTRRIVTSMGSGHRMAWAADFDNDGDQDVVNVVEQQDRVDWHENDGSLNFTRHLITTLADGPRAIFPADLDGDGDMDVLSASNDDNKIAWYENRWNEASHDFGPQRVITTALDQARAVYAADVDGDGDLDALSGSVFDRRVAWYENRLHEPSADFGPQQTITTAAYLADNVVASDVDFDGDTDVLSAAVLDNEVAWYENNGSQSFTKRRINLDMWAHCVLPFDLDQDGDQDVLIAAEFDHRIAWYENRGGQYGSSTTAVAPGVVCGGAVLPLLRIVVTHKGRAGDAAEELSQLRLELLEAPGDPLSAAEANALIDELKVFRDTGSGVFDGADTEVATLSTLNPVNGVETLVLPDGAPGAQIPSGSSATFFVVARIAAQATTATPNHFRVVHASPASVVEDAVHDLALRAAFSQPVSTSTVTVACACTQDADADGYTCATDCNDGNPAIHPGAAEVVCDGVDNDCDPGTADGVDADADGYACAADCNDGNPAIHPGADEIGCDGIDNDCDPGTADAVDADADGHACATDCNDGNPAIHPGATEVVCDGVDNDCDPGTADAVDADADGYACATDCNDGNPAIHPGAAEVVCDGVDNDCNPGTADAVDADADGYACAADCNDGNPAIHPGAAEVGCDGVDNDCNPATTDAVDADADGYACAADCNDGNPAIHPGAAEIGCDGVDNDCNPGTTDALDADADGRTCVVDCDDSNGAAWSRPGEVTGVELQANRQTITWSAPTDPGGAPSALRYDAVRSGNPTDFQTGGVCVATGGSNPVAVDAQLPLVNAPFFYLVRAVNACPGVVGTWGFTSAGVERSSNVCP